MAFGRGPFRTCLSARRQSPVIHGAGVSRTPLWRNREGPFFLDAAGVGGVAIHGLCHNNSGDNFADGARADGASADSAFATRGCSHLRIIIHGNENASIAHAWRITWHRRDCHRSGTVIAKLEGECRGSIRHGRDGAGLKAQS